MIDSNSEKFYRTRFLISRYHERETPSWEQLRTSAMRTTTVVRNVVESLIEHSNRIGDRELKTLYRLCQNPSDGLSAEKKREQVQELELPQSDTEQITKEIDQSVGSVGAAMGEPELHVVGSEAEQALHHCFQRIVRNYNSKSELVEAANELVRIDFHGVQSGRMSPILHYLAPEVFPVINGRSKRSIDLLFNEEVDAELVSYLDEREKYLELRNKFDFEPHFRDLDYFLNWVQSSDNEWTEPLREEINRTVWKVQPGSATYSVPEQLWPIWQDRNIISAGWIGKVDETTDELGSWADTFVKKMSLGDVVIAKRGINDLLGLGVISKDTYEYVGGTSDEIPVDRPDKSKVHESIRQVDWVFTRNFSNPIYIGDWDISKQFGTQWIVGYYNFQELRWHISEKHHDEVLSALKSLESKRLTYALGKDPDTEPPNNSKEGAVEESVPDAPNRADEIGRQLKTKNQVVFYGPPGTGKTYTAERFAKWWTGTQEVGGPSSDRIATVTFHPSFTYEDFVEGLSATTDSDGEVAYEIEDGTLKHIRKAAAEAYEKATENETEIPRYVLLIDEINRGNLAQIFGELITLLETDKRGSFTVDLAHSGQTVTLPPNLYLIGTMNTADQSIALVDTALRRRFRFIDFPPNLDIVWKEEDTTMPSAYAAVTERSEDISRREQLLGASVLAVRNLNDRILHAPELGKGKQLGHSHLLEHESVTEIVDTWRYDILPQLEEYYFGQFDRLRDELLNKTGELLIQWDEKQIQSFSPQDLYTALCNVADIDNTTPLSQAVAGTQTNESNEVEVADGQGPIEETVDAFRDRVEPKVEPEIYQRVNRLLNLGEEIGQLDTGQGSSYGIVQLKTEKIDPNVGVLQVGQTGEIEFKWNRILDSGENNLPGGFVDEAADVFNPIEEYNHEWHPDAEANERFTEPRIQLHNLSESEMETLIDGLKTFVQKASRFQDG